MDLYRVIEKYTGSLQPGSGTPCSRIRSEIISDAEKEDFSEDKVSEF